MKDKGNIWVGETFQVVSWFVWLRVGKAFIQPPDFSWWPVKIFTTPPNPLQLCPPLPPTPRSGFKTQGTFSSACVLPVITQGIGPYSPLAALQHSKMRELQSILSHEVCSCCGWNELLLCPQEWVAGVQGVGNPKGISSCIYFIRFILFKNLWTMATGALLM